MSILSMLRGFYGAVVEGTKELFIRLLMGVLIFLGYVLLSLFIYAIMRRIMVPQKLHVKPVYFYFDPECNPKCSFPRSDFELYGGSKLLSSGHYYTIALDLELPESPVNEQVGVFMVNLTLYSTGNKYLDSSARPAMLRYKSFILQTASTLFYLVPLLFDFTEEKQHISVVLFESYYEPYGDGTVLASMSILNPKIQLYSAVLTIEANFTGFTYYLYRWPIAMSVIVVTSIFITLCTCTVIMWLRDVMRDYDHSRRQVQRRQVPAARAPAAVVAQIRPRGVVIQTQAPVVTVIQPPEDNGRSEAQPSTSGTRVQDVPGSSSQSSTPTETESHMSTDFNQVIESLESLRSELETSRDHRESEAQGTSATIRQRTPH